MPQDSLTGAAANEFGRRTARLLARALGATMRGRNSNEAVLAGERVVIKCAKRRTGSVGVSRELLKRVTAVLGAFERADGAFEIRSLPSPAFSALMRFPPSGEGKVGMVARKEFFGEGSTAVALCRPAPGGGFSRRRA